MTKNVENHSKSLKNHFFLQKTLKKQFKNEFSLKKQIFHVFFIKITKKHKKILI